MSDNLIYEIDGNSYVQHEKQSNSRINRRCIDGSLTGCGNCVGYCQYQEHPGFLTQQLRKKHHCINKQCRYYLPKPPKEKHEKIEDISANLLSLAKQSLGGIDDLCVLNTRHENSMWVIGYITVFGQYNFTEVEEKIQEKSGFTVVLQKLDYSFERCVELICSRC